MKHDGTVALLGRFQPFHKGHLETVKWLQSHFAKVYIIIGSADKSFRPNNPFTPAERYVIIRKTLEAEAIDDVAIFMIDDDEDDYVWVRRIQKRVPPFQYIVANNPYVWTLFSADRRGYSPVFTPPIDRNVFSASNVRALMVSGDNYEASRMELVKWRNLVHEVAAEYIITQELDKRVCDLHRKEQ